MKTTIRDIASHLGISHATVSRVLNGRGEGFISEATRNRVFEAAKEMGYRPNAAARALVTGRTGAVAVWTHTIDSPFYAQVLHQLEEQITAHGYTLSLTRTRKPFQDLAEILETPAVDGVIAVDMLRAAGDVPVYDPNRHRPIVFLGVHSPQSADYVRVDLKTGMQEAVEHLLHAGCRRIAYIVHEEMALPGEARIDAYSTALRKAGLGLEVIALPDTSRACIREAMVRYVPAHGSPDGLLCQNDDIAIGAFRGLRDLGLRVPDDVRLIGCDGIDEIGYFDPPFSTIQQPIAQMCALAWQFLEGRLGEPSLAPQQISLPAHLLIHGSS